MRVAAITFAVVTLFVFGGCADNAYYQTRYMPTSSDESFSAGERLFWKEDAEVYDLPSRPPALAANEVDADDDHRPRIDCAPPGPKFQPERVAAGNGTEIRGNSRVDGLKVAAMRDNQTGVALPPDSAIRIIGWHEERERGARDDRPQDPVAGYDTRPQSVRGEGIDRGHVDTVAGMRDDEGWCPPKR